MVYEKKLIPCNYKITSGKRKGVICQNLCKGGLCYMHKPSVNKQKAEYFDSKKDFFKKYRSDYYERNKEELKEKMKKYLKKRHEIKKNFKLLPEIVD